MWAFLPQNLMMAMVELRSILYPDFLAKILNQTPLYMLANCGATF